MSHVRRHDRVHRIPPPTLVTIARRPLSEAGQWTDNHTFPKNGSKILASGSETIEATDPSNKILFFVRALFARNAPGGRGTAKIVQPMQLSGKSVEGFANPRLPQAKAGKLAFDQSA
jgi:hypothetical protein